MTAGGQTQPVGPDDLTILRRASGALVVQEDAGYVAAIDPTITAELRQEGVARELISRVQRMRKEAGFAVSDRITLAVYGETELQSAIDAHRAWIMDEVLARALTAEAFDAAPGDAQPVDLDGIPARVTLNRIA